MTSGHEEAPAADEPQAADQATTVGVRRDGPEAQSRKRAAEKRRLAEVFGDVLPESTSDDVADPADATGSGGTDARDAEILRDVPPHH